MARRRLTVGMNYIHYLLPRPNGFMPEAEALTSLIQGLIEGGWLPPDGGNARWTTHDRKEVLALFPRAWTNAGWPEEASLVWYSEDPVGQGVRCPLYCDFPGEHYPYSLQIHIARDYVYMTGGAAEVESFQTSATQCPCGRQLVYERERDRLFLEQRIFHICPECRRTFDVSSLSTKVQSGWTGAKRPVMGGVAYRFALAAEWEKFMPEREAMAGMVPDLLAVWDQTLGVGRQEVDFFR